jgi:hypothetical protein
MPRDVMDIADDIVESTLHCNNLAKKLKAALQQQTSKRGAGADPKALKKIVDSFNKMLTTEEQKLKKLQHELQDA